MQIGAGGPLVKVDFDAADGLGGAMRTEAVSSPTSTGTRRSRRGSPRRTSPPTGADEGDRERAAGLGRHPDGEPRRARREEIAGRAGQGRAASRRARRCRSWSPRLKEVQQGTKERTKKKWVKVVAVVGGVAAVVVAIMGVVIFAAEPEDRGAGQAEGRDRQGDRQGPGADGRGERPGQAGRAGREAELAVRERGQRPSRPSARPTRRRPPKWPTRATTSTATSARSW